MNIDMKTRKSKNVPDEAVTLKATEPGLKIVDIARRKKGWSCSDAVWVKAADTSIQNLNNFWQCMPIPKKDFISICYALEITRWKDVVRNHATQSSYRQMRTRIANSDILIKTLHDLNIDVAINSYLYVDYDCISYADVIAILKGQYDLGWCRNDDDGYFYMVASLVDIAKKYKIPDLINSINTSYALNKIVSETESQRLAWGLVELKQYTKDINSSELIQLLGKLKLVPQLLKLGASIEQITEVFGINAESLYLANCILGGEN
ncbi:hypothetical protein NIES2101_10455 [Calothrix sp. HK-06]|nr:hypothetical protein NIES2101_10455 [Calothrix sp. HK-06]